MFPPNRYPLQPLPAPVYYHDSARLLATEGYISDAATDERGSKRPAGGVSFVDRLEQPPGGLGIADYMTGDAGFFSGLE